MTVTTKAELAGLRAAGKVVARALVEMRKALRPGVTTAALDDIAGRIFKQAGARSGPQLAYDFPGVTCISVNDEAVHGIPGPRQLRDGDMVKLDVTAELDGLYADACVTAFVGKPAPRDLELAEAARRALVNGIRAARTGAPLNAIGRAVETTVASRGFSVCRALGGHGIGRQIHEPPSVLNYHAPKLSQPLRRGLVLTIEPIISAGTGATCPAGDGWTVRTADGARSAHVEHTLVVQDDEAVIVTA